MSQEPPGSSDQVVEETAETFCYGHPDTPTKLRCSRCSRPICGRCAIPASVGQHCPECVAEARRSAPRVRTAMAANAPVILGIIAVTVGFFVFQQLSLDRVTRALMSCPGAIADGESWRLITPVLVHANFIHIAMNMLVLYVYGMNVEQVFGSGRFLVIYVVSGLSGSAVSFAFGSGTPSVGASGAVFGVVGALVVYLYKRRSSQFIAQHLSGIMGFLVLNAVIGLLLPQVDVLAHLGGLAGGAALGFAFDRGAGVETTSPGGVQVAGVLATSAVAIGLVVWKSSTAFVAIC